MGRAKTHKKSQDGNAKGKAKPNKSRNGKATMAELADKFSCYQKSVQSPEHEIEFFDQAFKDAFGRKPRSLREDFCGTFSVCCEWVRASKKRTAVGVDLCPDTLDWGRNNNLAKLKKSQQERVTIYKQDVRKINEPQVDVLAAQNFSFWIFKTRAEVIKYFKAAHSNLCDEGVMVMDMMGGGDCYTEDQTDKRWVVKGKKGFKYHWTQARFNPVNADCEFHISFKFKDGSKMKKAFVYEWRFWTIPEVRELLAKAGFSDSHVYWELEDDDGGDTGIYEKSESAPSNPSWICYIVGIK